MSFAFEDFKDFLKTFYEEVEGDDLLQKKLTIVQPLLESDGIIYSEKYKQLYFQILALELLAFENITSSASTSESENVSLKIGEFSISTGKSSGAKAETGNSFDLDDLKRRYLKLLGNENGNSASSTHYNPFINLTSL